MLLPAAVLALAGAALAHALPSTAPDTVTSAYAIKERHTPPHLWTRAGPADKTQLIDLQIGLKQRNTDLLERHLLAVSDPSHVRYGQHLSAREVRDLVAPADESVSLVTAWLEAHGIDRNKMGFAPARDWVSVVVPLEKAEELLRTEYAVYRHADGTEVARTHEWSLPVHLHEHVDVVQPTTSFLRMRKHVQPIQKKEQWRRAKTWARSKTWVGDDSISAGHGVGKVSSSAESSTTANVSAVCSVNSTTPTCLRTLYGTLNYTVQAADRNSVGICNYLNETNKRSDIAQFLAAYRPDAVAAADEFTFQIIANASNNQGNYTADEITNETNVEGNLDAELVLSISWPTPMTAFSTGGSPPFIADVNTPTDTNEPYLVFLNTVLAQDDLPLVISSSYGDDEQTVPEAYARRVCDGFAQLGARGISVLFSSGDAGVGSDGTCYSNDGKNTTEFLPAFPAGCPWVTAVGGTANFNPETAVTRFASGAGFSNYFAAPAYQKATVDAYIAGLNGTNDGLYNKTGRGYPDVAAQGNHDAIVWNSEFVTVGGTSASSPTFAAVIALVNDALLAAGKPPLGFLNPWIYGGAYKALTDVTIGSSYGCDTDGFPATEGWDAVTGFGTPNFGKLVELALQK